MDLRTSSLRVFADGPDLDDTLIKLDVLTSMTVISMNSSGERKATSGFYMSKWV